jgi:hypothetical protein
MKNNFCKFKKGLLLSGVALFLSTFSVQAMEEERTDDRGHNITNYGRGTLETFSDETLVHILSYLPPEELVRIAEVSHDMNGLSHDNSLWKSVANSRGIKIDPQAQDSIYSQIKDSLKVLKTFPEDFLTEGKNHIVTIAQLQLFKKTLIKEIPVTYQFKYKGRNFELRNALLEESLRPFLSDRNVDNIHLLNPSAYATFTWLGGELNSWHSNIVVDGGCPADQDLSNPFYQQDLDLRADSPNFRRNSFSIQEKK